MCDQPRSEARSPRCKDEEAWKKDHEETKKDRHIFTKSNDFGAAGTEQVALDKMAPDMHNAPTIKMLVAQHLAS